MGFLDKLKRSITGIKDESNKIKDSAARANKTVDDSVDRTERRVDESADRVKRAGDKAKDAVDDTDAASEDFKKE